MTGRGVTWPRATTGKRRPAGNQHHLGRCQRAARTLGYLAVASALRAPPFSRGWPGRGPRAARRRPEGSASHGTPPSRCPSHAHTPGCASRFRTSDPNRVKSLKGVRGRFSAFRIRRKSTGWRYEALPERSGCDDKVGRKVGRVDGASGEGTATSGRRSGASRRAGCRPSRRGGRQSSLPRLDVMGCWR
jgi:hypothetical protein